MSGAEYFLTYCTHERKPGLTEPATLAEVLTEMRQGETDGVWHLRTAVVMPDHIHLVVVLGESANLASAIRLFKGRLTPRLRLGGLRWQKAYFDHRMRPQEDPLPVFLSIFLNPYRAGLLQQNEQWPGYFCCEEDWAWFGALTNESVPVPEWLA
jgi:REP element-mobilizing transposase RayT